MANMEFMKNQVKIFDRRAQKIAANPDPTKPKSNAMMYELERDNAQKHIDDVAAGAPYAVGLYPAGLFRAMGFNVGGATADADRATPKEAKHYFERVAETGLPYQVCDRCTIMIPQILENDAPIPNVMMANNWECENLPLASCYMANKLDVPFYYLDIPFDVSDRTLNYVTQQFREVIAWLEGLGIPGIKYSEEKLVEIQNLENRYYQAWRDVYELRKQKPCPLEAREAFREPRLPSIYHDQLKCVEYMEQYAIDMKNLVASGNQPVPNEKLRIMWCISGPFFEDHFTYLAKRDVSVPWFQIGAATRVSGANGMGRYGELREYGRKLTPLEEEARMHNQSAWGGTGKRWIDDIMAVVEDLDLDGIFYFQQWGCTPTVGLGKMVAEEAEKRFNIPTLCIEGRMIDQEPYDSALFREKMDEFLELALEKKKENGKIDPDAKLPVV